MAAENMVSITFTEEDKTKVQDALTILDEVLRKYLVALKPGERMELPKMSDGSAPFVTKALAYAESTPDLAPAYLDVPELRKDVEAVEMLQEYARIISRLNDNLGDTIMLAGSEAYTAALTFYNSVKQANKMNVVGAKTIYEDLKQRFEH